MTIGAIPFNIHPTPPPSPMDEVNFSMTSQKKNSLTPPPPSPQKSLWMRSPSQVSPRKYLWMSSTPRKYLWMSREPLRKFPSPLFWTPQKSTSEGVTPQKITSAGITPQKISCIFIIQDKLDQHPPYFQSSIQVQISILYLLVATLICKSPNAKAVWCYRY